jgi:hypothetical protein
MPRDSLHKKARTCCVRLFIVFILFCTFNLVFLNTLKYDFPGVPVSFYNTKETRGSSWSLQHKLHFDVYKRYRHLHRKGNPVLAHPKWIDDIRISNHLKAATSMDEIYFHFGYPIRFFVIAIPNLERNHAWSINVSTGPPPVQPPPLPPPTAAYVLQNGWFHWSPLALCINLFVWLLVLESAFRLHGVVRRKRSKLDRCSSCGYSRQGLSSRSACPECGCASPAAS